jgi:hypothetical protein
MKILLTGASGFIGRRLCEVLRDAGHALTALSRDPVATQNRLPQLDRSFVWDPMSSPPPPGALENVEAIIHLAGESLAGRWNAAKKKAIRESRVLGTRHLVQGLAQQDSRPKTLISASAVGYYGDRGDENLTEESAAGSGFLPEVCRDWEAAAAKAQTLGLRVVRLRTGIVLGSGGGALQAMLLPFRLGLGGPLGPGRQWWSWIHREDLIGLISYILRSEIHGAVNTTAPAPLRQRDFAKALGKVLRRPAFLPAPAFAIKALLGEFSSELLSSKRVLPKRAQEIGYRFRFPELEAALNDILHVPNR